MIWENRRQVGDPILSAPATEMNPTLSVIAASAKISSEVAGIVMLMYGTALNEQAVARTFVLAGRVTAEPSRGTAPDGQVEGDSQRLTSAARWGQLVRGLGSGVADICGMEAAPIAFMLNGGREPGSGVESCSRAGQTWIGYKHTDTDTGTNKRDTHIV